MHKLFRQVLFVTVVVFFKVCAISEKDVQEIKEQAEQRITRELENRYAKSELISQEIYFCFGPYHVQVMQRPLLDKNLERTVVIKDGSGAVVFQKSWKIKRDFKRAFKKRALRLVADTMLFPITLLFWALR